MNGEMKYFQEEVIPSLKSVESIKVELQRIFNVHLDLTYNQKLELVELGVTRINEIINNQSLVLRSQLCIILGKVEKNGRSQTVHLEIKGKEVIMRNGEIFDSLLDNDSIIIFREENKLLENEYRPNLLAVEH